MLTEDGFALLIEMDQDRLRVLLDCGRTGTPLLANLEELGVPPEGVDYVVLSHGHRGHIGGLNAVTSAMPNARVVCDAEIAVPKFKSAGTVQKPVGNPDLLQASAISSFLDPSREVIRIADSVAVLRNLPLTRRGSVHCEGKYLRLTERGMQPDEFPEELALAVRTSLGIVVVTACAHRGVLGTLQKAREAFPGARIDGVVGGFHIGDSVEEESSVIRGLQDSQVRFVAPCHCTGRDPTCRIAAVLADRFREFSTGRCLNWEV